MAWASEPVVLFTADTGDGYHGLQTCRADMAPVLRSTNDVVDLTIPACHECHGWLSTRFGLLLTRASTCYTTIDANAAQSVHADWTALLHDLNAHATKQPWTPWLLSEVSELEQAAREAVVAMAERSRVQLDTWPLLRALGAHGLRVPVTASEAPLLHAWSTGLRLVSPPERARPYEHFDTLLDTSLTSPDTRLVAVPRTPGRLPTEWGLPIELALLAWCADPSDTAMTLLHLPAAAADGITALHRRGDVGIASDDEHDPMVLAGIAVLWGDARTGDQMTFDDIVHAARYV